jgi:DNA-binding beta-propeller fold protein YncE
MKRRTAGLVLLALIGLLVLYLLFWPIPVQPAGIFVAPADPPMEGIYETNTRLQSVSYVGAGDCLAPEDVAFDGEGHIYAGMEDGRIMRFDADSSNSELLANTGGRPGGLAFDSDGNLIVADGKQGLLSVAPDGTITVLAAEADGRLIALANGVVVASDGTIYFRFTAPRRLLPGFRRWSSARPPALI